MSWNWLSSSSCHAASSASAGCSAPRTRAASGRTAARRRAAARSPSPVAALGARLGGVGAAVVLEVQLADDRRQLVAASASSRVEELVAASRSPCAAAPAGRATRRSRSSIVAASARRRRRRSRTPAGCGRSGRDPCSRARLAAQLLDRRPWRCRCRPAGSGRAPPMPSMPCQVNVWCGRRVESVPGELLGEEAVDPGAAHDLRQLAVVAEHVGVPELACSGAPKLALEEALAVQELAHQRLADGQVAVGLDPRSADRHPAARRRPARRIRSYRSGLRSLIQSYCCACEQANRNSG